MSGLSRLMRLFRKATTCLSAAAFCLLWIYEPRICHAQASAEDEPQVTLKVLNDFIDGNGRPQPVTFRLWSEKPWNPQNPVREQVIRPGQKASIDLLSPDRYTVEVQWKNHVWRTLPMHLKQAAKDHPDKALLISVLPTAPAGEKVKIPPHINMSFGSPQKNHGFFDAMKSLQDPEFNPDLSEPGNWPRMIEFRNNFHDADGKPQGVEVRMRSERPLTAPGAKPSSGVKLNIAAGASDQINLVSPDPFTVEIVVDGKEYSAGGLPVKNAIFGSEFSENRAFFLIGSLSNSGEPTLILKNAYGEEFLGPKGDQPIDLLHRPKNTPAK
jgi:hypothetical protein